MSQPIVSIDTSEIRTGRIEALKSAIGELVEFVDQNEILPLLYHVYLDQGSTTMTVIQVHPDSESMEYHMKVADAEFRKFADLIEIKTIDIYGKPSQELMERMRRKAELLGTAQVNVHGLLAGFTRLGEH